MQKFRIGFGPQCSTVLSIHIAWKMDWIVRQLDARCEWVCCNHAYFNTFISVHNERTVSVEAVFTQQSNRWTPTNRTKPNISDKTWESFSRVTTWYLFAAGTAIISFLQSHVILLLCAAASPIGLRNSQNRKWIHT